MQFLRTAWLVLVLTLINFISLAQSLSSAYTLDNPSFLNGTITDYDVFLTAEMHWRKENNPRKKKMIEYLASRNSIDVIVVERSCDFGHWVNYFLETGDSLFLKEYLRKENFFSTKHGVVYEDEYAFYTWLRDFSVKHDRDIKVVGIDIVPFRFGDYVLWSFLKYIEQNPDLQNGIEASVEGATELSRKKNISTGAMLKWYRYLERRSANLKIDDADFVNFLYNMKQSVPLARKMDNNYRDGQIAANFLKYISKGQKVYGQYGLGHVALKNGDRTGWDTFASVLNKDDYYTDKILSIGLICFGCDADTRKDPGEVPGSDIFQYFLTQEEFDRLKPEFEKLPNNTFVDLRNTNEKIKDYCQLLLVEFD